MKTFASIFITLLLALVGVATWETMTASAQTISAYSVTDLTQKSANTYSASLSIVNGKSTTPAPGTRVLRNGDAIVITTTGCDHASKGENGIITGHVGSADRTLLFSSGATCKVVNVVPAN